MSFKDIPNQLKPREKAIEYGLASLNDVELLAIILRTGTSHQSVVELSHAILNIKQNLFALTSITKEELMQINGIKEVRAIELLAVLELSQRIIYAKSFNRDLYNSPELIFDMFRLKYRDVSQEHFIVLFLNTKNHLIQSKVIFVGSLNMSIVHPREIFKEAIKLSASKIICVHNHPSGDPSPSGEDLNITNILVKTGEIVGIPVLDHIIVGHDDFVSLRQMQMID